MATEAPAAQPIGELFLQPDVDAARAFFAGKSRTLIAKMMTVADAVERFIPDGCYLGSGGFGSVRISTAVLHEIVRRGRKHLGFAGHTTTHDFQIMAAGRCFDRCDAAYIVGIEVRGLSACARRYMESGEVKVTEWSNATLGWRYKAAAMGVPFLPVRSLLGTDTMKYSAAKEITCPFTGVKLAAVPALFPDVGIIHVHRADVYGNAQVDGITVADWDLARASKRLILTTERIVDTAEIRERPSQTMIPYWLVDAVCHVPYGSYPGNMPYDYYSDEEHLAQWMEAGKTDEGVEAFLQKYIHGVKDFAEYLELAAGEKRLAKLREMEPLRRR